MKFKDLLAIYERKKAEIGLEAQNHLSALLIEAKKQHYEDFVAEQEENRRTGKKVKTDHEQSWRAFKGKNLEKLIGFFLTEQVEALGLKVVNGNKIERSENLSKELSEVKRNLAIDYGKLGLHVPDIDLVIYEPNSLKVVAVLSVKATLRERVAQAGYWKLKLSTDSFTKHIRFYLVTLDEDGNFSTEMPNKPRAIAEADTDGSYILTTESIVESAKAKRFDQFALDLKKLIER